MWISKNEYEKLKADLRSDQELISTLKQHTAHCYHYERQQEVDEIIKKHKPETVPFSTYYAERFEWWKKQFGDKTHPHRIIIETREETFRLEFDDLGDFAREIQNIKASVNEGVCLEIVENGKPTDIPISAVDNIKYVEGHPEPYTPEEIEAWAKKQLDEEMQEWKVVRGEKTTTVRKGFQFVGQCPKSSNPFNCGECYKKVECPVFHATMHQTVVKRFGW